MNDDKKVRDRIMENPRVAFRRRGRAPARPGVEADMVVVSARGKEYGRIAVPRSHLKAQKVAIERERALKVSDREVDVPDGCFGMDFHVGGYPRTLALRSRREREIFGPYMHLQAGQLVGSRALLTQRAVRAKVVGMAHKLPHWR